MNTLALRNHNTLLQSEHFVLKATSGIEQWFLDQNVSLGFSTYQSGKLFFIGLDTTKNSLNVFERNFKRCMGLSIDENDLSILAVTLYQIWKFHNIVNQGHFHDGYDKVFVPQLAYTTGNVSGHDVSTFKGTPVFINTLFNCLAAVSTSHSFKVLWKPDFISGVFPEDRCHLNGLAMKDGRPFVVSAISRSDKKGGWRQEKHSGGVLIDLQTNGVIVDGLSMPHSPRFYREKLWLLNSGTGEFGYIVNDKFIPVAVCPGYLRGMSFVGDYAIVGLSLPRSSKAFQDLTLDDILPKLGGERCGLQIINIVTGKIEHSILVEGVVRELYDVITVPGAICPMLIGLESEDIERMIRIE